MSCYRISNMICHQFTVRGGKYRNIAVNTCRLQRYLTTQAPKPKSPNGISTLKLALIGTTLGAISGTAYSIYCNWKDKNVHMQLEVFEPKVINYLPNVKMTKRVVNVNDQSGLELVLFQFQTCPFCCKVRSYLDFCGISYSVVEVDAVLRQDLKWSDYKKVPILLARKNDGQFVQLTDSSAIISILASYMNDNKQDIGEIAGLYPSVSYFDDFGRKKQDIMNKYFLMYHDKTPKGLSNETQEQERKWRTWADNHLVHLVSPNCYNTWPEAFETFEWFSEAGEWSTHFAKWERNLMVYVGAIAMWMISKMLKKRHGLSDDVRSHMYDALDEWTKELETQNTKFMGGKHPNLADLAVFGVISSMEGCRAFKDCLNNTRIGNWFYAVKEVITKNRGSIARERLEENVSTLTNTNIA